MARLSKRCVFIVVTIMKKIRRYSELILLPDYYSRLEYLKVFQPVGVDTFGSSRYLNQAFYRLNPLWKQIKREVILRDQACDLGVAGLDITGSIYVHHLNPITEDDLINQTPFLLDPEYLICCSHKTHNAIHYGTDLTKNALTGDRKPGDTSPWR